MSSFVIDKKNYIIAAGIIAGISEASNRGNGAHVWLYDYESGRNAAADDYYRQFCRMFDMNCLSVAEQYHETDPWTDGKEYRREFAAAIKTGKSLYMNGGDKLKKAIMELRQFFHSAIYQTEKYEYLFQMQMYFYGIEDQLMEFLYPYEPESWGDLKITA